MGWFSGRYDDERDASKANNHARGKIGHEEQLKHTKQGNDNYAKRWWN